MKSMMLTIMSRMINHLNDKTQMIGKREARPVRREQPDPDQNGNQPPTTSRTNNTAFKHRSHYSIILLFS